MTYAEEDREGGGGEPPKNKKLLESESQAALMTKTWCKKRGRKSFAHEKIGLPAESVKKTVDTTTVQGGSTGIWFASLDANPLPLPGKRQNYPRVTQWGGSGPRQRRS